MNVTIVEGNLLEATVVVFVASKAQGRKQ